MALEIYYTNQFKKELKKQQKRGKDMKKFALLARLLAHVRDSIWHHHVLNMVMSDNYLCRSTTITTICTSSRYRL